MNMMFCGQQVPSTRPLLEKSKVVFGYSSIVYLMSCPKRKYYTSYFPRSVDSFPRTSPSRFPSGAFAIGHV